MQTIRERLIYARKLKGYTQESLAAKTSGVTRSMIANIEVNRWKANPLAVKELSEALNIEFDWLMDGIGPMEIDAEKGQLLEELHDICSRLTKSEQLYILDTIRLMRKYSIPQRAEPEQQPEPEEPSDET